MAKKTKKANKTKKTSKKVLKKRPQRKRAKATARQTRAKGRRARELDASAAPRGLGLGSESGGQSGDLQGLSRTESADSESVAELVEEGQPFEASVVDSVQNAPDPDEREIETSETPEDDVPRNTATNVKVGNTGCFGSA